MGYITNKAKEQFALKQLDWDSDTYNLILCGSGHVSDADDVFVSDCATLDELSGTGYAAGFGNAGRKALTGAVVSIDNANDRIELKADNMTWAGIDAGTIAYVLVYKAGTSDTDSLLIGRIDISPAKVTNGGDMTVEWANHAGGVGVLFRQTNA
jgi:hypothetical protein